MKTWVLLLTACVTIAPEAASADENRGWYVGASLGISTSDLSASDARSVLGYTSVTVDNTSVGGRAFGGFRFNPHVAAEFGWAELGYTKVSGSVGGLAAADELLAGGPYGAIVGKLPLTDEVALLGKLGLGAIMGIYTCKQLCPSSNYSTDKVTTVPLIGAGMQFDFHRRFALRLEYEYFGKVEFDTSGVGIGVLNATYRLVTAGFLFKF